MHDSLKEACHSFLVRETKMDYTLTFNKFIDVRFALFFCPIVIYQLPVIFRFQFVTDTLFCLLIKFELLF